MDHPLDLTNKHHKYVVGITQHAPYLHFYSAMNLLVHGYLTNITALVGM